MNSKIALVYINASSDFKPFKDKKYNNLDHFIFTNSYERY